MLTPKAFTSLLHKNPGLESKLRTYCQGRDPVAGALRNRKADRRVYARHALSGKVRAQVLDHSGSPVGRPFAGRLADISTGGISFYIRSARENTARMLLGRTVRLDFQLTTASASKEMQLSGTVIAAASHFGNEYSLHIKFQALIEEGLPG